MAVKTAAISATSDGDNTVIAAVTGKRIRVLGYVLNVNAAGTVQWKSGASTALSGAMEFVDGGGVASAPVSPFGRFWFQTAAGEALVLATATGVDGLGHLIYETVG